MFSNSIATKLTKDIDLWLLIIMNVLLECLYVL